MKKIILIFVLFCVTFTNTFALSEKIENKIQLLVQKIENFSEKKGNNFRILFYNKIKKYREKNNFTGKKKEIIDRVLFLINKNIVKNELFSKNISFERIEVETFSYTFPDGSYKGLQKRSDYNLPARFNGVISYPQRPGKYPLVFIIHGGSPDCMWKGKTPGFNKNESYTDSWEGVCPKAENVWKHLPKGIKNPYSYFGPDYSHNYMGMSYLVEELAKRGMIGVSVDASIQSNVWLKKGYSNGLENANAVVQKHYNLLKDINIGKNHGLKISNLKGKIDFEKIGIIGHSNGGVAAYFIASEQKLPNIDSLVLLQAGGYTTDENTKKYKKNTLVVRGTCDEQLGENAGLYLAQELQKKGRGTAIISDVLIDGIGHGDVNTLWSGSHCKDNKKSLSREKTEEAVSSVIGSFLQNRFSKKENNIEYPKNVKLKLESLEGEKPKLKILEKTSYLYKSPKTIKRIFSKEAILQPFPPKEAIGEGQ